MDFPTKIDKEIAEAIAQLGPLCAREVLKSTLSAGAIVEEKNRQEIDAVQREAAQLGTPFEASEAAVPSAKILNSRGLVYPTISRSSRLHVDQKSGRLYGELEDKKLADTGSWRAGVALREQCLPLIVAVDGTVTRAWEVLGWQMDAESVGDKKLHARWFTQLGEPLSADDLERIGAPFTIGDELPTIGTRAFWPTIVDVDGCVYRAGRREKWMRRQH